MRSKRSDHHTALRTKVIQKASSRGVDFLLAELQNSKDDVDYSLHAEPTSFALSGLQPIDLLATLGFAKQPCPFFARKECLSSWVDAHFPLDEFAKAFPDSFSQLESAEKHLTRFGLLLPRRPPSKRSRGDGHTSPSSEKLKEVEDESFLYVLSWVDGPSQKGWTYHHRPKHPPLSPELEAALRFVDLSHFSDCPYFEFEPCYWQFFPFRADDSSFTGGNAQIIHDTFAELPAHFPHGLESLTKAHALLAPFGFNLLEVSQPVPAQVAPVKAAPASKPPGRKYEFDVAISFAGPQRDLAESLANLVRGAGFVPFFDAFYPEQLWGKDLVVFFDNIYRKSARYCVIFISQEYRDRMWTNHERRSAQARALEERGKEYILPIRVDGSELPGLPPTVGYVSISDYSIEQIAGLLVAKFQAG